MRGAERPGKTKWTRPFLPPLNTLSLEAAKMLFLDISDPVDDETLVEELLQLTGNLPLAVTLIASLAEFEGCDSVFKRWKLESTSLLSDGMDKQSNLDKSIMISLTSPRMATYPGSQELLSLLSLLPDGISEEDLELAGIPLPNIGRCCTTLRRTALAFVDRDNRLKALVPIRQYIQRNVPPSYTLLQPLQNYLYKLVHLIAKWEWTPQAHTGIFQQVTENLGNIYSLIEHALHHPDVDTTQTINCVVDLSAYDHIIGYNCVSSRLRTLLLQLEPPVQQSHDLLLQGYHALALLRGSSFSTSTVEITDSELWAQTAMQCFSGVGNAAGQGKYLVLFLPHFCDLNNQSSFSCNMHLIGIPLQGKWCGHIEVYSGVPTCSSILQTSQRPSFTIASSSTAFGAKTPTRSPT